MSLLSNYDSLWKAFIRPYRQTYHEYDLGPPTFLIESTPIHRTDLILKNRRGLPLKCSHYEVLNQKTRQSDPGPCVVYLHCNTGCRLEAKPVVELLLPLGISVFCFDFAGCGMSGGEYISLGWFEKDDLEVVIKHLKNTPKVTKLALWGRSMGAVTGLLYMEKDFSLFKGLVLDSPFSNLAKLAEDVAISKTKLPSLVIKGAMALIKQSIYKKIKLNMAFLALEPLVQRIHNPPLALFAASKTDTFVKFWHIETLYKAYKGEKRLIHLQGDHNEARRPEFLSEVGDFLLKAFNLNKKPQNIEQNKENSPFAMNSIPIIPLASKNPEGHKVPLAQIDLNIESIEGNFMETFSKSLKNLNENDFLHFFTTETENEPRSRAITHDGKLESKEMAPITPLKAEIEVKEPNYEVPNERAERSISALNDYSMFYAKPGLSSLNNDIEGYFSTSYKGNNNENTTEGSTGLKNASIDESILEDEGSPGLEKRYRLMKPKAKAVVKSFNFEKGELKGKRSNKPGNSGLKKGMKVIGEF